MQRRDLWTPIPQPARTCSPLNLCTEAPLAGRLHVGSGADETEGGAAGDGEVVGGVTGPATGAVLVAGEAEHSVETVLDTACSLFDETAGDRPDRPDPVLDSDSGAWDNLCASAPS